MSELVTLGSAASSSLYNLTLEATYAPRQAGIPTSEEPGRRLSRDWGVLSCAKHQTTAFVCMDVLETLSPSGCVTFDGSIDR